MKTKTLFVPGLEPAIKHATIFNEFNRLDDEETLLIINDHDPKPLYFQLIAEHGNVFSWDYLQEGPEEWRVALHKIRYAKKETIGTIVSRDIRKAEVFRKYGIDFCCGGKKTLEDACLQKGIDVKMVEEELKKPVEISAPVFDFNKWDGDFLADYIYNQHHKYFYNEEPVITELMEKVVHRHGGKSNNLVQIQKIYLQLKDSLAKHFYEEETVIFPIVRLLVQRSKSRLPLQVNLSPGILEILRKMEGDHEDAGGLLKQIEELTNNYTAPAEACNSYKFLFQKLKDLQSDLHQHIHLENNILFPKALELEKTLQN
jgi:regulator of cell morphogenesis and NO signaling